ncbi:Serine proteinase stubble, partial [Trachymyrmex cornetzi]
ILTARNMNKRSRRPLPFAMLVLVLVQVITTIVPAATIGPLSRSLNFDDVRPEEDDNAVVVEAAIDPDQFESRESRGILWNGAAARETCLTSKGEVGRCTTFKECYPYFKIPDLGALDGWVLGVYDTCSYIREDGNPSFGICCSNLHPFVTPDPDNCDNPTADNPQVEDNKKKKESAEIARPQAAPTWPPQVPTHPPDHTIPPLPTHPPSPGLPTYSTTHSTTYSTTLKPSSTSSKRPSVATTWPTKRPEWWITSSTSPSTTKSPTNGDTLSQQSCGAKNGNQDQERIVGGKNADPGEWPWMVALLNAGRQFCGGSLIDNIHVLTAAHCVANMNSWDVARLIARLGDHNIKTNNEIRHIERRVKKVVRHRGFNSRTLYNDVALLTLSEPVEFTEQIRPICLPSGSQLYSGKTATVIGWGSLRESGPQPAILQEVSVPVWPNSECKLKYGSAAPGGIVDSFLCAGRATKDSCSGDSGGPLMVNDGRWTQVGIVSWGIGCGKGQYPGVYTRVTHFLQWIHKNLK